MRESNKVLVIDLEENKIAIISLGTIYEEISQSIKEKSIYDYIKGYKIMVHKVLNFTKFLSSKDNHKIRNKL